MNFLGGEKALIEGMLDSTALRHRVIAENIANTNTPNYRAKEVVWNDHLGKAVVQEREGAAIRQDGNSVDMETEQAEMQKNELVHRLFLQSMFNRVNTMRSAIRGSGG